MWCLFLCVRVRLALTSLSCLSASPRYLLSVHKESFKSTHSVHEGSLMDRWLAHLPALTLSRTTLPAPPRAAKRRGALSMTALHHTHICGAALSFPTVLDVDLGSFQEACTAPSARDGGIGGSGKCRAPRKRPTREENSSSPKDANEVQRSRRTHPSVQFRSSKN